MQSKSVATIDANGNATVRTRGQGSKSILVGRDTYSHVQTVQKLKVLGFEVSKYIEYGDGFIDVTEMTHN